jgi:flagellar hook-associated protein 3 FlgL
MTLRLSTAGIHQQGLSALLRQQSNVARAQLELTTQQKLINGADNPSGMANAKRLEHALSTLEQQDKDSALVEHRLRTQEQALTDVGTQLDRARQLTVQAGNGALSDADRASIAGELRQIKDAIIAIGNRDDGTGNRLFAGSRDGVSPFVVDANGGVSYIGDDGRNQVEVAPGLRVGDTDPGSDLFLRIRTGDGLSRTTAGAGNTGSGVIGSGAVTNTATWAGRSLTVHFTAPDAYELRDDAGGVVVSGPYVAGSSITAGGIQMTLSGAPAAGDSFTIAKAPTQDVFATIETLADALDAPAISAAEKATRQNAIQAALGDISSAQDHFLSARSDTGTRLAALDDAKDGRGAYGLGLETMLSNLRDVDPTEAASRLALQSTALEAAQRTLIKVQQMSIFDLL